MAAPHEKAKDSSPMIYHSRLNDPHADMVIKVTDGTLFRVHSYNMKCYSTYFREMPEFDTAIHGDTSKSTVDLEITQEDLANILQLHDIDAPPPLCWEEAASALASGEQYGFLSLPTHLAAKSLQLAAKWPWAVFVFAARHDFFLLAKHAIIFFYAAPDSHTAPEYYPAARFKDVPGDYVTALFQAIGPDYMTIYPNGPMWQEISGRFKLNV